MTTQLINKRQYKQKIRFTVPTFVTGEVPYRKSIIKILDRSDRDALRNDWIAIGNDLKTALVKFEKEEINV